MPYHLFFHFQHSCDVFSRFPLKQSLVLSFPSFQSYLFKRKFQNYSKLKLFKIFSFLNIFSIFCNNYILLGKILRYKFSSHTKNVNLKRFDVSVICVVCVLDCLFPSAYLHIVHTILHSTQAFFPRVLLLSTKLWSRWSFRTNTTRLPEGEKICLDSPGIMLNRHFFCECDRHFTNLFGFANSNLNWT